MASLLDYLPDGGGGATPPTTGGSTLGNLPSGGGGGPQPIFGAPPTTSLVDLLPTTGYRGGGVGANKGDRGGLSGLGPEGFHILSGLVPGLIHLGGHAAHDTALGLKGFVTDPLGQHPERYHDPNSVVEQVAQSFKRTGGRVVDFGASLAPGGESPVRSQYGKAYSTGHLLGALTEDLANLSVVGSIASKPLGLAAEAADASGIATRGAAEAAAKEAEAATAAADAARQASMSAGVDPIASARYLQAARDATAAGERAQLLDEAARAAEEHGGTMGHIADALKTAQSIAEKTATLTGKGANAPFLPIEWAGKAVGGLTGAAANLGEVGAEGGLGHPVQMLGDAARAAQAVGPRLADAQLARNLIRSGKFEGDKMVGPISVHGMERAGVLADPTEEVAHSLLMGGQAHATVGPYERLHAFNQADHAQQYLERTAEHLGVDPEALQHAYDSLDPTNQTPEMVDSRTRMAEAERIYREQQLPVLQEAHLAGRDVPGGTANEAQLEQAHRDVFAREAVGETPEAMLDPANAPARYRPMLRAGEQAVSVLDRMKAEAEQAVPGSGFGFDQLKADAITSLQKAVDAGLDPAHVIGGEVKPGESVSRPGVELPRSRNTGATKFKEGYTQPMTVHDQTVLMARRARAIAQNDAARIIQEQMGHTPAELLGHDVTGMSPKAIVAEMRARGYVAWDPASPLARKYEGEIDASTVFIPKTVANTFRGHFNEYNPDSLGTGRAGTAARGLVKASDVGNRAFKAGVLYLSPRWIVGHTVGHSLLALAAGVDPITWASHFFDAYKVLKGKDLSGLSEAERSMVEENHIHSLLRRGQAGSDIRPEDFVAGGKGRIGLHPIKLSQHATSFIDDMNRVAVALAKADKGFGPGEEAAFLHDHPDLAHLSGQKLVNEYAVRESLKVLGDFSNLTSLERDVMGRIVLFYPWMKHITGLAFDLAVHDPVRVAWTLHLADLFGPHGHQLSLTQGKWDQGGGWFDNLPKLNPFEAPFSYMGATGSGSTPLASLNPMLALASKGLFGFDPANLQPLSRPAGFGPTNDYGSPSSGHLSLKEFAQQLLGMSPQAGALTQSIPSIFGHEPVVRYDTGQPVRIGHQDLAANQQRGGPILGPLLNLVGVGATRYDLAAIEARAEAKRKLQAEQRKGYNQVRPGRAP